MVCTRAVPLPEFQHITPQGWAEMNCSYGNYYWANARWKSVPFFVVLACICQYSGKTWPGFSRVAAQCGNMHVNLLTDLSLFRQDVEARNRTHCFNADYESQLALSQRQIKIKDYIRLF